MAAFAFLQVDVFASEPLCGNPVAVVAGADPLSDLQMAALARWTNLSETTFLLRPSGPEADYRLRIFTPAGEIPFAGHPTLGSCHAWLATGGVPRGDEVVQQCDRGLVRVRRDGARLAFVAPPLLRRGPLEGDLLDRIVRGLGIDAAAVVASQWVDNGPGWTAVLLGSGREVLALRPDFSVLHDLAVGVAGPWNADQQQAVPGMERRGESGEPGCDALFEVRAFAPRHGVAEDPVTGSLNAGLAQWLIQAGRAPARYVVSQGTAVGRAGRVHVQQLGETVWIGGETSTRIEGMLTL